MIRTVITGVLIGLVTLWLWDKYQRSRGLPGESILARVTRLWSSPGKRDREFPINASVVTGQDAGGASGGCRCS